MAFANTDLEDLADHVLATSNSCSVFSSKTVLWEQCSSIL